MVSLRRLHPSIAVCLGLLAPLAAHADRLRVPLSGFNMDAPAGWRVGGVKRLGPGAAGQYFNYDEAKNDRVRPVIVVYAPLLSCEAATALQAGDKPFGRDWLPAGWSGKIGAEALATVCSNRAGFPIVLMSAFDPASRTEHLALLHAFESAWTTPPAMAAFEVVELPESRFKLTLPPDLAIADTDGFVDQLELSGPKGAATFAVSKAGSCEVSAISNNNAVNGDDERTPLGKVAPSTGPAPAGWKRFDIGTGHVGFCSTLAGEVALVIAPGDAAIRATGAKDPTTALLDALAQWLPPVTQGATETTLEISKLRLRLVDGWSASVGAGIDIVQSSGGSAFALARGDEPCDKVDAGAGAIAFNPVWMPAAWRASLEPSTMNLQACATIDGKAVLVVFPTSRMPPPREVVAWLEIVRSAASAPPAPAPTSDPTPAAATTVASASEPSVTPEPYTPHDDGGSSHHHGPILPFPVRLSYQTVGAPMERGHGARLALSRIIGAADMYVRLDGEIGYDTLTKLDHDLQVRAAVELTGGIAMYAAFGHDALGSTEDMPLVAGGLYGGLGAGLSSIIAQHPVALDGLYLWRDGVNEVRFSLTLGIALGPLHALVGDIRLTGDATTVLVGSLIQL